MASQVHLYRLHGSACCSFARTLTCAQQTNKLPLKLQEMLMR